MSKIYISGPITGIDDFDKAEKELNSAGFSVVNPVKVLSQMPEDTEYEEYMAMMMLSMCDSIYMLKGWEESTRANREHGYALATDITIIRETKGK
jgi:hypothetical protein